MSKLLPYVSDVRYKVRSVKRTKRYKHNVHNLRTGRVCKVEYRPINPVINVLGND